MRNIFIDYFLVNVLHAILKMFFLYQFNTILGVNETFFRTSQKLPLQLLGQVREEEGQAEVQRNLRLRLHLEPPGHGDHNHPQTGLGSHRHRGIVSIF